MENLTKIRFGITEAIEGKALSTSGIEFDANASDEDMFFLVTATAEDATLTVKAGENVFAGKDETFTAPAGTSVLRIETGKHRKDGTVTISGKTTTKVAAIVLE